MALEFALGGLAILMLLLFVLEIAWQMAVGAALESGARMASRYGITGQTGSGTTQGTRLTQIRQAVLDAGAGLLQSSQLTLQDTAYGTFAAAAANSGGTGGAGTAGQVTVYALSYVQPCIAWSFAKSCSFTHSATATVLNEPFPN